MTRLCVLLLVVLASPALAERQGGGHDADGGRGRDHDQARAARNSGAVLPLGDILAAAQGVAPGRVIGVDLAIEGGRWVYDLDVIAADGRLVELAVDAATGAVLAVDRGREDN